ncbi:MAG: hypothetical protein J6M19_00565 [Bacteroidaceae bacterium]|nr:hypothetical protein [Bacteroidaceae bacterium]
MATIKDIAEMERARIDMGAFSELHLWREGTFLRGYEWSAYLACRFLHDFKVSKRQFKDIESPVAYIGFPESSLPKWTPEGAEMSAVDEKHLVMRLSEVVLADKETLTAETFAAWKEALPLASAPKSGSKNGSSRKDGGYDFLPEGTADPARLTTIMGRILAFPIESKSPLESMAFLAEVKRGLAGLI